MNLREVDFIRAAGELRGTDQALDVEVGFDQVLPALARFDVFDTNAQALAAGFIIAADKGATTIADNPAWCASLQHRLIK